MATYRHTALSRSTELNLDQAAERVSRRYPEVVRHLLNAAASAGTTGYRAADDKKSHLAHPKDLATLAADDNILSPFANRRSTPLSPQDRRPNDDQAEMRDEVMPWRSQDEREILALLALNRAGEAATEVSPPEWALNVLTGDVSRRLRSW